MLLAIDVGNTQTVLGLYEGERLAQHWRVATEAHRTGDELAALYRNLIDFEAVSGICLASTVPALVRSYEELAERWLERELIVLGPGTRTGIADSLRRSARGRPRPDRQRDRRARASRRSLYRGRFRDGDQLRRHLGRGRVRRRCARAGDRDLDGGALRPRGAAASGGFRRAGERDRQEHGRGASVGARLRLRRPGRRDRRANASRARRQGRR